MFMARASVTSSLRNIDYTDPTTWEFCGFSQNGEDGIIDVLINKLKNPNRYCIEIGIGDGIQNNTAWLLFARRYTGMMIDGAKNMVRRCKYLLDFHCLLDTLSMFVDKHNVNEIKEKALYWNPDVFSLDIDGNDYYVAEALFNIGFRPKIVVVEYNSAFGSEESIAIKYEQNIYNERKKRKYPITYWGVSLEGG